MTRRGGFHDSFIKSGINGDLIEALDIACLIATGRTGQRADVLRQLIYLYVETNLNLMPPTQRKYCLGILEKVKQHEEHR